MMSLTHKRGEGVRITLPDRTIEIIVTSLNPSVSCPDADLAISGLEDKGINTFHLEGMEFS